MALHEFFVIVRKTDTGLEAHGCVTRELAHSSLRIPHTSVNLLALFEDTHKIVVHKRPEKRRVDALRWDIQGGHMSFELGLLTGSDALAEGARETARREANEELRVTTLDGKPHIIPEKQIRQFTDLGELRADSPNNVEFSTGFIVFLPANSKVTVLDEDGLGNTIVLEHREMILEELLARFQKEPHQFADGASRVLIELRNPESAIRDKFIRALNRCG